MNKELLVWFLGESLIPLNKEVKVKDKSSTKGVALVKDGKTHWEKAVNSSVTMLLIYT
jgi:hypothetical protein